MITLDPTLRRIDGSFVLFQEQVADQKDHLLDSDHFRWAIACGSVVLQRTRREGAFPVIQKLLNEWSPVRCSNDEPWSFRQLVETLKPSGLAEIKALRIAAFSRDYMKGLPVDLWPGLKGYTRDSVLIFTDGKYLTYWTDRLPNDKHLVDYVLRWRSLKSISRLVESSPQGTRLDDPTHSESSGGSPADHLLGNSPICMKEND